MNHFCVYSYLDKSVSCVQDKDLLSKSNQTGKVVLEPGDLCTLVWKRLLYECRIFATFGKGE
jgi:hypothetical protein